jgi:hypothetical protein
VVFFLRVKEAFYIKKNNAKEEVTDMKKLIFVATVLTVVAFAFGAIAAQQKATPPPAKAAPADVWNVAPGVIEKIDAAAKTLEVKTKIKVSPKKPAVVTMMTFATNDKTKFFTVVKGKEKKFDFADLKTGMKVTVNYKVEAGKNIAISVKAAGQ